MKLFTRKVDLAELTAYSMEIAHFMEIREAMDLNNIDIDDRLNEVNNQIKVMQRIYKHLAKDIL